MEIGTRDEARWGFIWKAVAVLVPVIVLLFAADMCASENDWRPFPKYAAGLLLMFAVAAVIAGLQRAFLWGGHWVLSRGLERVQNLVARLLKRPEWASTWGLGGIWLNARWLNRPPLPLDQRPEQTGWLRRVDRKALAASESGLPTK